MRWYTRIVFGLNTIYQLAIGLIGLLSPVTMLGIYKVSAADQQVPLLQAAMRGLGYNFIFAAIISALIARNPDRPVLLPLMAILSGLTIVAWLLALAFGEMTAGQVGVDIVAQILLLIGALGYYPTAKRKAAH